MKAVVYEKYGDLDVLELKEVNKPIPKENEILIKNHASGINFADSGLVRGKPFLGRLWQGLFKPKKHILGAEIAGIIESVGINVKRFKPGDEIFADIGDVGFGGFAEYVAVPEKVVVLKPTNLTFEEAAVVPVAAVVALQGLRNHGKLQSGQKILINGASGGIGSFAVQIAKTLGAEVTGVCSTKKLDKLRSLGADHVIDYTKENFTQGEQRYDLILDNVANHSFSNLRRALTLQGIIIPNSGHSGMGYVIKAFLLSPIMRQQGNMFLASSNSKDLDYLKQLIEDGKVTPVIDKTYPLSDTPEAFRYLEEEHARGKVVITVEQNNNNNT